MATTASYGETRVLSGVSYEQALTRVTTALQSEGFGVLTTIDVQQVLKRKLGVEHRPYHILGACNPELAHQALEREPLLGLLLPCNVVVFEEEDGAINISAIKTEAMFRLVENPALQPIAEEVRRRLIRVLERL